jgi:hypothetical protein
MKLLCLALSAATALLVYSIAFQIADAREFERLLGSFESPYQAYIPEEAHSDPEEFLSEAEKISREHRVNIVRISEEYASGNEPEIVVYAHIEDPAAFYSRLPLTGGISSAEDAERLGYEMSTKGSPGRMPAIADFAGNDALTVRPLREALANLPVSGTYHVLGSGGAEAARALLAAAGASGESESAYAGYSKPLPGLEAAVAAALAAAALSVYRVLSSGREVAVMRLHGHSKHRAFWRASIRSATVANGAGAAATVFAALFVPNAGARFAFAVLSAQAIACAALAGLQLAAAAAASAAEASWVLKSKRADAGLLAADLVVKALVGAALAVRIALSADGLIEVGALRDAAADWESAAGYAVFTPFYAGNDSEDFGNGAKAIEKARRSMYMELNALGAVVCDASDYVEIGWESAVADPESRYMLVNPNYLEAFPVLGSDGEPVSVDEGEADWILLVPESRRSDAGELTEKWERQRSDFLRFDSEYYAAGPGECSGMSSQAVRIVWTRSGQRVFAFDTRIGSGLDSSVEDPVMAVMTQANAAIADTAFGTGGVNGALKAKIGGSAADALESMRPMLERLGLDDNFRSLVTVSEWHTQQAMELTAGMMRNASQTAAAVLAAAVMSYQVASIHFDRRRGEIAARRLFGHSAARIHQRLAAALCAQAAAQAALAAFSYGRGHSPGITFAAACAIVSALDAAFTAALAKRMQNAAVASVLKGY